MGILDGYQFDSNAYGGTPPGWLGTLLQPLAGPAPGFASDPLQMPTSAAPPPGGAMGPQMAAAGMAKRASPPPSDAGGLGKDPGASNPFMEFLASLASPVGTALSASPAAMPAGPRAAGPDLFDRLSAGASNFTTGGNQAAGVLNSLRGLAIGQRIDAAGVQQANQMATFKALVGAGISPQVAQVAALNPEILRTIVAAHFSAPSTPRKAGASGVPAPQPSIAGRAELEAEARRRGLIP
jgi:hypothetical protein